MKKQSRPRSATNDPLTEVLYWYVPTTNRYKAKPEEVFIGSVWRSSILEVVYSKLPRTVCSSPHGEAGRT